MVVHPQIVMKGHQQGCAAAKQGKFNEFRHAWWEKVWPAYTQSHKIEDDTVNQIASSIGLDMDKFKQDADSSECKSLVSGDMQELGKWHVNATPNFFINGRYFVWNGDPGAFKVAVNNAMQEVEKSGVGCGEYYAQEVMQKGEQKFRKKGDPKPN